MDPDVCPSSRIHRLTHAVMYIRVPGCVALYKDEHVFTRMHYNVCQDVRGRKHSDMIRVLIGPARHIDITRYVDTVLTLYVNIMKAYSRPKYNYSRGR